MVGHACAPASPLASLGLGPGSRLALVRDTSAHYTASWLATQLGGLEIALLDSPPFEFDGPLINLGPWWDSHQRSSGGNNLASSADDLSAMPGAQSQRSSISTFIHTSGTTGKPKLLALSHDYLLRLGRFFADSLCLTHQDRVFAPLPMFHINPLGYGLVGALSVGASVLGTEQFSASKFWPIVKEQRFSALVLHAAPTIILATTTTGADARGHHVRVAFGAQSCISALFDLPICVGGYGSTEAAGLTHSWHFRAGDRPLAHEGISNFTGRARFDIDFKISPDGEILVRSKVGNAVMSGYLREGTIDPALDADGWLHTGDRGRIDELGCLIFIERMSESIRCKGEYVPIEFVESVLSRCPSLGAFALWRLPSQVTAHEGVI